jgi:hypothetical protein
VGDEENASIDLSTGDGFGSVVQEADDAEPIVPLLADPRADPVLRKLPLHTPHGLEYVLQSVEMVERTLSLIPGEPELRHLAEQHLNVERVFQCLLDRSVRLI